MKSLIIASGLSISLSPLALAADQAAEKKFERTLSIANKDPWDLDVHGGGGFGNYTNKYGVNKTFGGYLAGVSIYNENLLDQQTATFTADILVDAANQQVIRKGFGVGTNWAVFGGKKRTIERLKTGVIVSQSNYSISWNNRLSYDSFTVTPVAVGIDNLDGSNVSWLTGLGINLFYGTESNLGLSLMSTVLSFSSSIEKSTQKSTEFGLAWRTYL